MARINETWSRSTGRHRYEAALSGTIIFREPCSSVVIAARFVVEAFPNALRRSPFCHLSCPPASSELVFECCGCKVRRPILCAAIHPSPSLSHLKERIKPYIQLSRKISPHSILTDQAATAYSASPIMHVTTISLLYAGICFTLTAYALIARSPNIQARGGTTPEYPKGYDAESCPLDRSTSIIIQKASTQPNAVVRPAAAPTSILPTASTATERRDLTPDQLGQICRRVAHFPFTGEHSSVSNVYLWFISFDTTALQPGLYVASVKANAVIDGLRIGVYKNGRPEPPLANVINNQSRQVGATFQVSHSKSVYITIEYNSGVIVGSMDLFKLGPKGYAGLSL